MIVSIFGLATSILTALLLALVENKFHIAIYSFMFLGIVPFGAVYAGFCAASGYYFGARLLHRRPTRLFIFSVITGAILTFFLVNYLNYFFDEANGHRVSALVPFSQYMDFMLRHERLEFSPPGITQTGEVGALGYAIALLQMLGFAGGGLFAYGHLCSAPYCRACGRYLPRQSSTKRYTSDVQQLQAIYSDLLGHLRRGDTAAAVHGLSGFGSAKGNSKTMKLNVELKLWKCAGCPQEFVELTVKHKMEDRWTALCERSMPGDWNPPSVWQVRQYMQSHVK